jgi:tetraacyldisaccharide 4'-kinase
MKRPDSIYRKICTREKGWAWIGWLLTPVSLLYGLYGRIRRKLYDGGILKRTVLPVTVVSIGNIEVGGVGKTPVTIWLARRLLKLGIKVAVVARNLERGRGEPFAIRPGAGTVRNLSDEVLMLGARLGYRCAVYAGPSKRDAAVRAAREASPDVILVDDGFQHLSLQRDVDVVVLDHEHPLGLGGLVPSGTLREFPSTLCRADFLWVNRSGREASKSFTKRKIAAWNWQSPFVFSEPVPAGPRNLSGESLEDWKKDVLAFCGIARPEDFRKTLLTAGFNVLELVAFPDHYRYTEEDVRALSDTARRLRATCMITTEKDAMKIPARLSARHSVYMLPIDLEVGGEAEGLLGRIVDCCLERKRGTEER